MKKYEKPVIVANDMLSEGVYAASGDGDCYTVTTRIHQKPETGRGDYRIQVDAKHKASDSHSTEHQTLVLVFNQSVEYVSANGTLLSGDGTNTLNIDLKYHNNATDNIGMGDVIVRSETGLAVSSAKMICYH